MRGSCNAPANLAGVAFSTNVPRDTERGTANDVACCGVLDSRAEVENG
jgi:hypothetical protein